VSRVAIWCAVALLAAGCAVADPRPVVSPAPPDDQRTVVVPVERDPANWYQAQALAREFAFGLAQRRLPAMDLTQYVDWSEAVGRPLPAPLLARLAAGIADGEVSAWLRAERVRRVVFLEIQLFDQVWAPASKRTRLLVSARGRDLADPQRSWDAQVSPEVEEEAGRGSQLATATAVHGLLRALHGEAQPLPIPRLDVPTLVIPGVPIKTPW